MSEFSSNNIVNVLFYYDGAEQYAHPIELTWQGREYRLGAVQFWYTERHQAGFSHHYTVADQDENVTFKLRLETDQLIWTLESVEMTNEIAAQPVREVDFGWISFKPEVPSYA